MDLRISPQSGPWRLPLLWAATVLAHVALAGLGVAFPGLAGYRVVSPLSDEEIYLRYADLMARGSLPYRDFIVEYPPLAMLLIVAPRLARVPLEGWLGPAGAYVAGFAAEMLLVDAALVWLVACQVERAEGIDRVPARLAWYSAYFAILCPLVVVRFDLAVALVGFVAANCLARGRPGMGGFWAGLGVLVKVVPGLILVPFLAGSGSVRAKVGAARAAGVVVGLGVLGCLALGGERLGETVGYHTERGVEIGSTYASLLMLAHELAGSRISTRYDHVSVTITAAGAPLAARGALLVQVACLAIVAWRARRLGRESSTSLAAAALLAYIIGGKVLSPQYLVWLIPFVAASGVGRWTFFACCLLTTATYPWAYDALVHFRPWAEALLLARNGALVWLWLTLLRGGDVPGGSSR